MYTIIINYYFLEVIVPDILYGGVAQVARACGSYPQCPGFESLHRHHLPECNFNELVIFCTEKKPAVNQP